jgi:signal transduction histidine kinase
MNARELDVLQPIIAAVRDNIGLDPILDTAVRTVGISLDVDRVHVWLTSEDDRTVTLMANYHRQGQPDGRGITQIIDEHPDVRHVVRDRKPRIVADYVRRPPEMPSGVFRALRVHALIGVPLIRRDQAIGIFSVTKEQPHEWSSEEIDLVSRCAAIVAIAVENDRLAAAMRRKMAELEEANRGLAALDEQRAQFAAMMVHDTKNPISVALATLEICRDGLDDRRRSLVANAINGLHASLRLLEDAVEVYRPRSSKVFTDAPSTDLNTLLEKPIEDARVLGRRRRIELLSELAETAPVRIDPSRFERVVRNLLDNALKFTPGGGTVRIFSRLEEKWAVLIVEDGGAGISPDQRERIFEPFFRGRAAAGEEGHGLGLALVRSVVEEVGGQITVTDAEHGGSRFIVRLPL